MRACAATAVLTSVLSASSAVPAPAPIVELVLDVPFATTVVGEPVECSLRIKGPRVDEKILAGNPAYARDESARGEDGFVYRFRYLPAAPGPHEIGPFFFTIDTFRLRSNTVQVIAYAKPGQAGAVRILPSRATVHLGTTVVVRVATGGRPPRGLRLKPGAGFDVVSGSSGPADATFVLKPTTTGTIALTADSFEGLAPTTPVWAVPIEVVAVPKPGHAPLPPPPRPGEEVTPAGLPEESR